MKLNALCSCLNTQQSIHTCSGVCYFLIFIQRSFYVQILKQENAQLENRSQLVMQCSFGPHLFINCVGFIKIDNSNVSDDG